MSERFSTDKLVSWLREHTSKGARVVGGRMPDTPNRVIVVSLGGGPGLSYEGLFDTVSFQIACRGAENYLGDAEAIALDVDDVLLNVEDNFNFGVEGFEVFCNEIGRTGGAPSANSIPDSESRWTFTCNYYAQVSTGIGANFGA